MKLQDDLLDGMEGIALMLDPQLRVVAGGWRNWATFWEANDGRGPAPDMRGQDITLAFSPGPLRSAFRVALRSVAEGFRPALRLRFRCDSPRLQREMLLEVTRVSPQRLLYHSVVLAETPWPRPAPADMPARPACPVCAARAPADAGALDWTPPEWPNAAAPLTARDRPDPCPRCHLALMSEAA